VESRSNVGENKIFFFDVGENKIFIIQQRENTKSEQGGEFFLELHEMSFQLFHATYIFGCWFIVDFDFPNGSKKGIY